MRGIWGLIGLVVTVAIVMLLVNKQLATGTKATAEQLQKNAGATATATGPDASTARQQSQQIQQQYKQALDAAMQPRPMPDDAR